MAKITHTSTSLIEKDNVMDIIADVTATSRPAGERVLVDFKTIVYPGPFEMNDTTWKESKHEGIGEYRLMTRPRWKTAFLSFRKEGKTELRVVTSWDGRILDPEALKELVEIAQKDLDKITGYNDT